MLLSNTNTGNWVAKTASIINGKKVELVEGEKNLIYQIISTILVYDFEELDLPSLQLSQIKSFLL